MVEAMPPGERFIISSDNVPDKIPQFADMVRDKIRAEIEWKMISLKVDGCTKKHRHFVGINVQYEKKGKTVVRTLAVEEMLQAATANNLKTLIDIVLRRYKIQARLQLVSFTVDSGANYVLAGKLLTKGDPEDEDEESDAAEAEVEEEYEDWLHRNVDVRQDDFSMQGVRCAAHTLQLSVADALKQEKGLKGTIEKVKRFSKCLLKDSYVRQLKEAKLSLPQADCVTRWGSTYDLLKSVFKLRNFIAYSLEWSSTNEQMEYGLTDDEWDVVAGILRDLRPVRLATTQLQREDVTLGEFFAIWSGVVLALEARKEQSALAQALLASMAERSKAVLYKDRTKSERHSPLFFYPGFCAAVFLDPRFMSLLTPDQVQEAKQYLHDLWDRMQVVQGPSLASEDSGDSIAEDSRADVLQDDDDDDELSGGSLFQKLLDKKNKERMTSTGVSAAAAARSGRSSSRQGSRASRWAALRAVLDEYDRTTPPLAATEDVFLYWEKKKLLCPELHKLAMVVLTIPASQVSVERLFSALKFILKPQRYGLHGRNVDDVTFLHTNKDLVKEVVGDLLQKRKVARPESEEDD